MASSSLEKLKLVPTRDRSEVPNFSPKNFVILYSPTYYYFIIVIIVVYFLYYYFCSIQDKINDQI